MLSGNNIFIKTFGCSLNQSDSELLAGLLEDGGFNVKLSFGQELSNDLDYELIDLVIINTCTVKNQSENKFFKELEFWKNKNKKIIVAGCIPQAEQSLLDNELKFVSVIGTRQLIKIVEVVNKTLNGEIIHNVNIEVNERLNLAKKKKSEIIEIIPICEGCLGNCSYCKTKLARGKLLSYKREDIILQFKTALKSGCKEFWLTSQDNGCYGFDIYRPEKYFLPQLINDLCAIDGDFRIRIGMANPNHIKTILPQLIESFKNPKIFKFLHIPLQSGSNKVLKLMNRFYTKEDFIEIVNSFKKEIPDIVISTDLIVGFPQESEEDFIESLELIKLIKPQVLNLSRFWLRSGTDAEKLIQVHGNKSKIRSEIVRREFDKYVKEENKKWIGTVGKTIIDEIGKNKTIIGRNEYYKQIIISKYSKNIKLGSIIDVKIIESRTYDLVGQITK